MDHYRKPEFCRVSYAFSSAKTRALGKELFAECLTLGTVRHSAKMPFAECQTLGKPLHSAKRDGDTHREPLPSATGRHSAKIFYFLFFCLQTFSVDFTLCFEVYVKIWHNSQYISYISLIYFI